MNEKLTYIESPNQEILIGATNDIDWSNATFEIHKNTIAFRKGENLLLFNLDSSETYLINKLQEKKSAVLCYILNSIPVFTRIRLSINRDN